LAIHTTPRILDLTINGVKAPGVHASKNRDRIPPHPRKPTDPQAKAISACGGDWKRALKVLSEMGPDVSLPAYHEAIGVCSRNRQAAAARKLLDEMRGVVPTVFTYNLVIGTFSKLGRWKEALELMGELRGKSLRPNVVTFNAIISACGKGRQWGKVVELLDTMKDDEVKPNIITFNAAISACEKGGQWEKTVELLDSMPGYSVKPDAITFIATIGACVKGGQWEKAIELLDSMMDGRLQPDITTFNAVIGACEKSGQWEKAMELLDSMKDDGVKPDVITFSACIEALHAASRFEEAVGLMAMARDSGFYLGAWRSPSKVDVHDSTIAVAQTILRLLLSELKCGVRVPSCDIVVVPGRGSRSGNKRGAFVPEQALAFLRESRGPEVTEVPENPVHLLLTLENIEKWRAQVE
jgi:pentatricopeptide repeat protein